MSFDRERVMTHELDASQHFSPHPQPLSPKRGEGSRKLLALVVLALLTGCSTYADRARIVRTSFYANSLAAAETEVDKGLKKTKGDEDVLKLEKAMVLLARGDAKNSEQLLREVRDNFDYLEQKSLAEGALSFLTDDNAKSYAGEDYERVLIRNLLALTNLMRDGGDAEAYSLQAAEKQQQIIQAAVQEDGTNPKANYQQVALGPYIRAALREETHHDYDDVQRSREMVVNWVPEFSQGRSDLQRAVHGAHSQPGHGVLYVFALVGRGPYKEEVEEMPSTVALLIADRILSAAGKQTLPPTIAPIKVPKVVPQVNLIRSVNVSVIGHQGGQTETITDIGRMACEQYEAVYPSIVAKAVVRRVLKKGIIYTAKEVAGVEKYSWQGLVLDAAGVVWEATENADTRCWSLLPDKIQVLRIELPAGDHEVGLQPVGRHDSLIGGVTTKRVRIDDGRNTYLMAVYPDTKLVGQVLVSGEE
jgi:hypothetical protein